MNKFDDAWTTIRRVSSDKEGSLQEEAGLVGAIRSQLGKFLYTAHQRLEHNGILRVPDEQC